MESDATEKESDSEIAKEEMNGSSKQVVAVILEQKEENADYKHLIGSEATEKESNSDMATEEMNDGNDKCSAMRNDPHDQEQTYQVAEAEGIDANLRAKILRAAAGCYRNRRGAGRCTASSAESFMPSRSKMRRTRRGGSTR